MSEQVHQRLSGSTAVRRMAAFANRIPFPYRLFPVRIDGRRMIAHTMDRLLALWLWKLGKLEQAGLRALHRYCRPGMRALDIGANIGLYTLELAARTGPDGHVWAFEPDPGNAKTLDCNLRLNQFGNVTVIPHAVGAESGETVLFLDDAHHGNHRIFRTGNASREIHVGRVSLDDFFSAGEQVDIVKVDVQGAEKYVLDGMRKLAARSPQMILLIELSGKDPVPAECSVGETVHALTTMGFHLWVLDEETGREEYVMPGELVRLLDGVEYLNVLARKGHTNG